MGYPHPRPASGAPSAAGCKGRADVDELMTAVERFAKVL
jgi:hypothetical protein